MIVKMLLTRLIDRPASNTKTSRGFTWLNNSISDLTTYQFTCALPKNLI